jgi:single-strand DNA-binding protein
MSDIITLTGLVATTPRHLVTTEGLSITSFRLASNQRRFDRSQEKWIDGDTNWYTVTAFRQLAMNAAGSISKADRVLITGRLRIREWESGDRAGTSVEIEAESLGHDLAWGTATFVRSVKLAPAASATEAQSNGTSEADLTGHIDSDIAANSDADIEANSEVDSTADGTAVEKRELASATAPF